MPPLVRRQPLHDDVLIYPALSNLDRTATDAHWYQLALPH
jgi:hypothetical protein